VGDTQILCAAWVLPIDAAPIPGGAVAVETGRVTWVGRAGSPECPGGRRRDLGHGVLLPGLVNAHTHLELSALEGRVESDAGFTAWVEDLVEKRAGVSHEATRAAARRAIGSLAAGGTVAVGDVSNALDHLDLFPEGPLRAVVYFEQIGWDPGRAQETLARAERRLRALAPVPGVEVRLAAHAPHSVSAELMRGLVARGGPAALHLAESPDEARFLRHGDGPWSAFLRARAGDVPFEPPGTSPVAYADRLGVLHERLLAAHCVQVDAEDVARLARHGVSVVVCPRSNRRLGVGVPPVPELLAAGVNVALGSDSLASAESLDVLDDARALRREIPELPPGALLRAATLGGARALGLADLGAIAPDRRAALAFAPATGDVADPEAFVIDGAVRLQRVA